jgi:hypothetical protein
MSDEQNFELDAVKAEIQAQEEAEGTTDNEVEVQETEPEPTADEDVVEEAEPEVVKSSGVPQWRVDKITAEKKAAEERVKAAIRAGKQRVTRASARGA